MFLKQHNGGRRRIIVSWHRYYDPSTGRYISADPIGLKGGINLFSYVQNDPINKIDPEGLITWWAIPLTITVGETVDYAVQSHYWNQINKMFWEQRRRLKKQLEEVDPYCDPERWKLLYDAYNDLIRNKRGQSKIKYYLISTR